MINSKYLFNPPASPMGSNLREFELRILDRGSKNVVTLTVGLPISEIRESPGELRFQILQACGKLIDTILKGMNLVDEPIKTPPASE